MEMTQQSVKQPLSGEEKPFTRLWQRRDIWQISLIFIVSYLLGSIAVGFIPAMQENEDWLTFGVIGVSLLTGVGSILLVNRWRQQHTWETLGFIVVSRQWVLLASGLIVLFVIGRTLLLDWLAATFPPLTIGVDLLAEMLLFETTAGIIFGTISIVIIVAIWEEFFFRGFIHNALRNRMGVWGAIIVSSLIFGLFHIIPLQIVGAFLLGLPLAWAYEKTGSLWLIIYMHALNNLLATLYFYLVM